MVLGREESVTKHEVQAKLIFSKFLKTTFHVLLHTDSKITFIVMISATSLQ